MDAASLRQKDAYIPPPKPVYDAPAVMVIDGNVEAAVRQLTKKIGKSRLFKLLALRKRNPSTQARARAKARSAESRRRMDMKKKARA